MKCIAPLFAYAAMDRSDLSLYWWITLAKREKAQQFIAEPTVAAFEALISPYHCSASRGWSDPGRFFHETIFAERRPAEVANVIDVAANANEPVELVALEGFDWPLATEILRAVDSDGFAVVNETARRSLSDLAYTIAQLDTFDESAYRAYFAVISDVIDDVDLRRFVAPHHPPPPWASPFELAECAFQLDRTGSVDLAKECASY